MKKLFSILSVMTLALFASCIVEPSAPELADIDSDITVDELGLAAGSSDVMLQAFHWEAHEQDWYNVIASKGQDIQDAGFTLVWFPPASEAVSDEGYLPGKLYDLDSHYGTQAQLVSAISAIGDADAIADIVINHRCGSYQIDGKWHGYYQPDWGSWAVVCNSTGQDSGTGGWDTGQDCYYAPDVDHTNPTVRSDIKAWLNWLKTLGFDGWRYDMVVGYAGSYIGEYNGATSPSFSVGENWDYSRQNLMNWIDSTGSSSTAFDFPTRNLLLNAVSYGQYYNLRDGDGNPGGAIGWWPAASVTFLENHDTEEARGGAYTSPFPYDKTMQGYAYILTHPGVPCVFWLDWIAFENEIETLIGIRNSQGITSTSDVEIQVADSSKYAAIIDGETAVKIGSGDWSPGAGWTLATYGSNYAVWTKDSGGGEPGGGGDDVRTVVFLQYQSVTGEFIKIRGGHDGGLVPSAYSTRYEDISYNNTLNPDTASEKASDNRLDWGTQEAENGSDGYDSLLDWTCDSWPSGWGTAKYYNVDGFGEDPENTWGLHYWKFDVEMSGSVGDWFEFKAFIYNYQNGGQNVWESDINQSGTPYTTANHWGKKGYITTTAFNQSWVQFTALN